MKRACFVTVLLCVLLSVTSAYAQVEKITSVEGITEYRLQSNGLHILLFPDLDTLQLAMTKNNLASVRPTWPFVDPSRRARTALRVPKGTRAVGCHG